PTPSYGSRGVEGWAMPDGRNGSFGQDNGSLQTPLSTALGPLQSNLWVRTEDHDAVEPLPAPPPRNLPPLRVIGQVGTTYIIAEGPDGLFLVDQHAAHERILYEKLRANITSGSVTVQPLLQPVPLELSSRQRAEVEPILPLMS